MNIRHIQDDETNGTFELLENGIKLGYLNWNIKDHNKEIELRDLMVLTKENLDINNK